MVLLYFISRDHEHESYRHISILRSFAMYSRAINVIKCTTLRTDSTNTYDTCFEIGIIAYKNKMIGRSKNNGKWSIKPSSCILVAFVSSENVRNNTVI